MSCLSLFRALPCTIPQVYINYLWNHFYYLVLKYLQKSYAAAPKNLKCCWSKDWAHDSWFLFHFAPLPESTNTHKWVHILYIYFVYGSRRNYTKPLGATEYWEPTLHISNHVPGLYPINLELLPSSETLLREKGLSICQILKHDLLFFPLCRGQPSQSRHLWVSPGLNRVPSFRIF